MIIVVLMPKLNSKKIQSQFLGVIHLNSLIRLFQIEAFHSNIYKVQIIIVKIVTDKESMMCLWKLRLIKNQEITLY